MLNKIWNDPVWSKVIGGVITGVILLIISYIIARVKGKNYLKIIIIKKVELWICFLFVLILIILQQSLTIYWLWNYLISFSFTCLIYIIYSRGNKTNLPETEKTPKPIFQSQQAMRYDFQGIEEHAYENNKPVGPRGRGSYQLTNHILNIVRSNTDGQYLIRILKYFGNKKLPFIEKDISKNTRTISIQFQAKVSGGSHLIWFIAKYADTHKWIDHANVKEEISNRNWQNFNLHFMVSGLEDFIIDLDDREVKSAPSSIQIRELVITEVD